MVGKLETSNFFIIAWAIAGSLARVALEDEG